MNAFIRIDIRDPGGMRRQVTVNCADIRRVEVLSVVNPITTVVMADGQAIWTREDEQQFIQRLNDICQTGGVAR